MSKKTASKGRPSVGSILLGHYGSKKVMFAALKAIADKAVKANKGRLSFAAIHAALIKNTNLKFGPVAFRNMLRDENVRNVPAGSTLGLACHLSRGAPKGSCKGLVRNPAGRPVGSKNKTDTAVEA